MRAFPCSSPDLGTVPRRRSTRADRSPSRSPRRLGIGLGQPKGVTISSGSNDGTISAAWTFQCAVEIGNFADLRRQVGLARAGRLIVSVQERLQAALPAVDFAVTARAGLEFRFDGFDRGDIDAALAIVATRLAKPVEVDGVSCRCELVLAGAAMPIGAFDEVRLAEELEGALTIARRDRRVVVRDLSEIDDALDGAILSRELPGAMARGEMQLYYQPKLHLRRQKVIGVEALIRWQHPRRGLILPGDFIPAAEEARVIGALTLWTLDQVLADQRRLAEAGHDIEIFVNISGQLLNDSGFVAEACHRVSGARGRIGFEITETSVISDPETAITHLTEIAAIGVPIAIDDYGAGLSSLAYLKQLPARELKIDKMFVMQLTSSHRDPLIVRSTIDLAHAMEMEVTAEGVETQAALALLGVMGCDMVQGFLISRPVPFEALLTFLASDYSLPKIGKLPGAFQRPDSFWKSG